MEKLSPAEEKAKRRLGPLGMRAEAQWQRARPKMCRELKESGRFYQSLLTKARRADQILGQELEGGQKQGLPGEVNHRLAMAVALEELFLPGEEGDVDWYYDEKIPYGVFLVLPFSEEDDDDIHYRLNERGATFHHLRDKDTRLFLVCFNGDMDELREVVGFGDTPSQAEDDVPLSGIIMQTDCFLGHAPEDMWEWLESAQMSFPEMGRLESRIREQWELARPKMCREMKADGTFVPSVRSQAKVAHRVLRSARRAGKTCEEAESLALEAVFLPEEEE